MAALALGSVASEEGHVITGRIVKLNDKISLSKAEKNVCRSRY